MTFQPGRSGNPAGRPRGSRNKRTILAEQILDEHAVDVTQAAIDLAKDGNGPALRMCLDRIAPPMRHRLLDFDLPALRTADDAVVAADIIVQGAAQGELTVQEAAVLMKLVRTFTLVLAAADRARKSARVEAPYAEDLACAPDRDAARHEEIDDDMPIAAQGARQGAVGAAKTHASPRPATQTTIKATIKETVKATVQATAEETTLPTARAVTEETIRQPMMAARAASQPRALTQATASGSATVARVRPRDFRDGVAQRGPRETGDRTAAAA